jgi:hypothetical protein
VIFGGGSKEWSEWCACVHTIIQFKLNWSARASPQQSIDRSIDRINRPIPLRRDQSHRTVHMHTIHTETLLLTCLAAAAEEEKEEEEEGGGPPQEAARIRSCASIVCVAVCGCVLCLSFGWVGG